MRMNVEWALPTIDHNCRARAGRRGGRADSHVGARSNFGAPSRRNRWALPSLRRISPIAILYGLVAVSFALSTASPARAQTADEEERFVVIKAKKIITITGKDVEDGMIVLVNGKIRSIGKGLEYPLNAKVIDAGDDVIMPGLINPHTRHGLPRYGRMGVQGHLSVADDYIPQLGDLDELVKAGYTIAGLVPSGAGIPGRATVVHTAGPTDKRILSEKSYLAVLSDKGSIRGAFDRAKAEIEKVDKAKKDFEEKQKQAAAAAAKAPASAPASQPASAPASAPASQPASQPAFQPPPIDPAHQPLVDLIQKKAGLFALVELSGSSDVLQVNQVLDKHEAARAYVLRNAFQSNLFEVASVLGEKKARVCLWPMINRMPNTVDRLHLPREFTNAGCEVSVLPLNDSGQEHARVLGRLADLVNEGWSREDALKSVTLNPAKLLGLDSRFGSIEKDRDADFTVLSADPLDPKARVVGVIMGGQWVYRRQESE